jgi:hypothetical protein
VYPPGEQFFVLKVGQNTHGRSSRPVFWQQVAGSKNCAPEDIFINVFNDKQLANKNWSTGASNQKTRFF